jgi:ribosome-interacting GTPase 1
VTDTHSESASYEFTTLTCIPGVIQYKGANIQLLDLPGIIEGAAQGICHSLSLSHSLKLMDKQFFFTIKGKGRGRQVIAVARTSDLIIIMLDATKSEVQRELLERELESVGIRLNKRRPNLYFKVFFD